ncbi:MAG: hypothetical protein V1793_20085 [Pseudomonadota bacterium]
MNFKKSELRFRRWCVGFQWLLVFLVVLAMPFQEIKAEGVEAGLSSHFAVNGPPVMNGAVGDTEWQGAYELYLIPDLLLTPAKYPIETHVYFLNDNTYLYVLVDAVGDNTESLYDECLMVFGPPTPGSYHVVETYYTGSAVAQIPKDPPENAMVTIARGFGRSPADPDNDHRFYEFRIEFNYIGINPGDPIQFYSPAVMKSGYPYASMPYDGDFVGGVHRDNIFPYGLLVDTSFDSGHINITGVDPLSADIPILTTEQSGAPIPTLTEWGMIGLILLLAGLTVRHLSRRRTAA